MMITLIQVKILIDTSGYTSDYILIIFIIILSMYIIFTRIVMYLFIYNSIIFQNLTFLKKKNHSSLSSNSGFFFEYLSKGNANPAKSLLDVGPESSEVVS